MSATADIPESVMEDAIGWFDDLRGSEDADRDQFAAWLMRSPTHIEAFLSVAALHGGFSASCAKNKAWLGSLLGSLIEDAQSNVLPLADRGANVSPANTPAGTAAKARHTRRHHRWQRAGLAAVILIAVSAVLLNGFWPSGGSDPLQQYHTALGEQRAIVLDDGSVMQLNTNSAVTVQYNADVREILLTSGEAIFDVRKDPSRPFRVQSGAVTVEAIGTRFNVYRHADETVVTVIEGRVAVEPADAHKDNEAIAATTESASSIASPGTGNTASSATVELAAGQQLAIRPDGAVAELPVPVDTERTTAWTQRRVVFDDDTLASVIAEFNRYNRTKLVINDAVLRERRISGIFTVDDPAVFAEVLASMAPVETVERVDGTLEIINVASPVIPVQR